MVEAKGRPGGERELRLHRTLALLWALSSGNPPPHPTFGKTEAGGAASQQVSGIAREEVSGRVQAFPGPLGSEWKGLTGDHLQPHHQHHFRCLTFIPTWREGPQAGQERGPINEGDHVCITSAGLPGEAFCWVPWSRHSRN